MSYDFLSKANTIVYLKEHLNKSIVLPHYIVYYDNFIENNNGELDAIEKCFDEELLIIRSSYTGEDTTEVSSAGRYDSILNVSKQDKKELYEAIRNVFESYDEKHNTHVLIQPMLTNARQVGVAMTSDIDTLAPYYVINYKNTHDTEVITSGNDDELCTFIYYKDSPDLEISYRMNKLITSIKEVEDVLGYPHLDIEYAIDDNEEIIIFQARPIVVKGKENHYNLPFKDSLTKVNKKIEKLMKPHPDLLGNRTVFGVMPDWNPAEIIGLRPQKLSVSLYKELITDNIWAYQRDNYGYRNLRSHPLMLNFLGVPYIDVRTTFNSFVPKSLDENIAEKLINYYIDKLVSKPSYHDKVEFKVVYSCYYLNLPEKLLELLDQGFDETEVLNIQDSLRSLTVDIISSDQMYKNDIRKIKILEDKFDAVAKSDLSYVDKIYWLIEDCKRYGTLPFAGIARAGFISAQFLNSFVDLGIIELRELHEFMNGLDTINRQMNNDLAKYVDGDLSREEFLKIYGHIRPGTYDILSERYDEDFEKYFDLHVIKQKKSTPFIFSELQISQINEALRKHKIEITAIELITFIRESIEAREYSKFVFTKSLSKILQLLEAFGLKYGISREQLAYLDISVVKSLYSSLDHRNVYDIFMNEITQNQRLYHFTKAIKLPSVILSPNDVFAFELLAEEPNYITMGSIIAPLVKEENIKEENMSGKVALIESADPGYDYLFSRQIGGLVTKFGGANSHMAIRCAELGIPAVIGLGEKRFSELMHYEIININCLSKQIKGQ